MDISEISPFVIWPAFAVGLLAADQI